ncbi:branched-chain amino acid ABC transporter permease [Cryobacterium frigoriphilum]|uniref:Branched-chain amino acid ABC transporter permease n=1 Tax=Cryobacterium frigoriphilum TaxID=1259150 RepID=A0A4R9A8D2_9MICO|nr:branched-chain amino acid ABC transporter permease [Cryobacterium frigoriphilum]TFD53345.1 branched-chain amino acid ABC transporter permease [Cryobacterium frigoriphilum]
MLTDFLQLTAAGLSQGSVYALLAVGLISVYTVRHVINIAQGDFAMMAGLGAVWLISAGMPLFVSIVAAVLTVTLVSVAIERLIIARVKKLTTLVSIILTLGVSTLLQAILLLVWGPEARGLPVFPGSDLTIAGVSIRAQELWMVGALVFVGGGIVFFYEKTRFGKALRACAEQPVAARIVGISPVMASVLAFAIAGFVGAIAGVVSSPIYLSIWSGGLLLGLKGFVAAVLGGFSSFRAAIVGALLLGVLESYVAGYVASGLRDAVAFFILILVLVIRTDGLVLKPTAVRV